MRLLGYLALLTSVPLISACRPTTSSESDTAPSPSAASPGDDGRVPVRDPLVGKWGFPGRPDCSTLLTRWRPRPADSPSLTAWASLASK